MFIPEIELARHLMEERLKDADRARLVRMADLAAKGSQRPWSSRLLAWSGNKLIDLGGNLRLRAGDKTANKPGCCSTCLVQA